MVTAHAEQPLAPRKRSRATPPHTSMSRSVLQRDADADASSVPTRRNGMAKAGSFLMTWDLAGEDLRCRCREAASARGRHSHKGTVKASSAARKLCERHTGWAIDRSRSVDIWGCRNTGTGRMIPTGAWVRCFRDDRCQLPPDCARSHRAPDHSGLSGPPGRSRRRRARNGPRRAPPRCLRRSASLSARRMESPRCA